MFLAALRRGARAVCRVSPSASAVCLPAAPAARAPSPAFAVLKGPVAAPRLPGVPACSPFCSDLRSFGGSAARGSSSVSKPSHVDVQHRLQKWDEEAERQRADTASSTPSEPPLPAEIYVVLGTAQDESLQMKVNPLEWAPADMIADVGPAGGFDPQDVVAAKVNGQVVDLHQTLSQSCGPLLRAMSGSDRRDDTLRVELLDSNSVEGKQVLWHSAAHVLGAALEAVFGDRVRLCDGPPLSEHDGGGFFYEMNMADDERITEEHYQAIQKAAKKVVKSKQRFTRLVVSRDTALGMFAHNPFKLDLIRRIPADDTITVYRCGQFVDLCRGPHVPHTGFMKGFAVTKSSGSHFDPVEGMDPDTPVLLQRLYGMAFTTKSDMDKWVVLQEEAKRRDHRVIGRDQQLFMFHEMSPGSAFMLPHGTRIYNTLVGMIRKEYSERGYEEVMTPLMYKKHLWKTSGHLDNYRDDMFMVHGGDEDAKNAGSSCTHAGEEDLDGFGLKPMNCPGHCLIYAARGVSYRDLPVRLADFSPLHRNEATGALGGLTRLRRFQQDDAHIFCRRDQVADEVEGCLDFLASVYGVFGFTFRFELSTRPEKFMGEVSAWNEAEQALADAMRRGGHEFEVSEGDGAFYGPKIDVKVRDALGREHQCATIQLDFQLPEKFELEYDGAEGVTHRPVMIHRAILGSVERMMAILIEHTGGRWPFWLSPRQFSVCPISDKHVEYAEEVAVSLREGGYFASVDSRSRTVSKRVRDAQVSQCNLILVVGDKEVDSGTVTVRCRDDATALQLRAVLPESEGSAPDGSGSSNVLTMRRDDLLSVAAKLKAASLASSDAGAGVDFKL